MSNTIEFDSNSHNVDSVSVFFQSNQAEVTRKIVVQLLKGQNTIQVNNLPTCIDRDSIRVDGIGNATIFDVVYHPPSAIQATKSDELRALHDKQAEIQAEYDIIRHQSELLEEYSKTVTGKDTNVKQLEAFMDFYAIREAQNSKDKFRVQKTLESLRNEEGEIKKNSRADEESIRKRGVRISIVVLADTDGEAELSLKYIVYGASWTPQYDVRANAPTEKKVEPSVRLLYRASITQTTGEDWADAELSLSTAVPVRGAEIPSLKPIRLMEKVPINYRTTSLKAAAPVSMMMRARGRARAESDEEDDMGFDIESPIMPGAPPPAPLTSQPPTFFKARTAEAVQGTTSTTFAISGRSNIPSDTNHEGKKHTVTISELDFDKVDLEWVTVPKIQSTVFLNCKVLNTSEYALLPGESSVFLNGSFVAKSSIPSVSPQERFSCSLGEDPAVRVTYHPQTKNTKTAGSILSAKTSKSYFAQNITVQNTRQTSLSRLRVYEQVPVSGSDKVKVNIIEPRALGGAGIKDSTVHWIKPGADVQEEVETDESLVGVAGAQNAQGMFEWVIEVEAGASTNLALAWEVIVPVGTNWTANSA